MDLEKDDKLDYVCINCGAKVKELHKKYSSSVLKIMSCEKCKQTADKYIEFEPIIILIDLVLLSQPAYRHVLYNTKFRIYSKILVVQLLFESYTIWKDVPRSANEKEFASEKEFYYSFILTLIDYMLLFLLFQLWTRLTNPYSENSGAVHHVKAMVLAKIAKFFMIPIVIWSNSPTEPSPLRLILVNVYYFLSLVQVNTVLANRSRKYAAVITFLTLAIKHIAMVEITQRLKDFVMI